MYIVGVAMLSLCVCVRVFLCVCVGEGVGVYVDGVCVYHSLTDSLTQI